MIEITINEDRCVRCLECVDVCPTEVIVERDGKPFVEKPEKCIGCLSCSYVCRADAILHKGIHIEEKIVRNVYLEEKVKKFV